MKKTVMSVDDSFVIREMISDMLQDDYDVVVAKDGVEALEIAESREIDLVLCDINMPRMCGLSFIEQFRKKIKFQSVPVMILTTESSSQIKGHARKAGARGWMYKTFDKEKLLRAVTKLAS